MTDDEGRYSFTGVGAGRYMLSASKTGHVPIIFGQARPGRPGTPIQLTDGQSFAANLQLLQAIIPAVFWEELRAEGLIDPAAPLPGPGA